MYVERPHLAVEDYVVERGRQDEELTKTFLQE